MDVNDKSKKSPVEYSAGDFCVCYYGITTFLILGYAIIL